MMLTANPTGPRLKFVWDKQKPQVEPRVMMDVIGAVAARVAPIKSSQHTWADRLSAAGSSADPRFAEVFDRWRHGDEEYVDQSFVDAVVALVAEMPEFKKASPIDGLIPWFAKEMNRLFLLQKDPNAKEYPSYYAAKYNRLQTALSADPIIIEWFEKKRPNLSKLDAEELLDAVEAFDQDRKPEIVYEWKDGWKIVKLATRTQIQKEGEALNNCLKKGSSYTDNYCKLAESGKSEFFSLRNPNGESVISIQWSPGQKTPEQVYAEGNEEPSEQDGKRISEWAESRGGSYRPARFASLTGSTRRLAEYIDQHCSEDDESIEHYARWWDEKFSVGDAERWIDALGCSSYEEAGIFDGAGVEPEEVWRLPQAVREYVWNGYTKDVDDLILAGVLAALMRDTSRKPRPEPHIPAGQERLPFDESVFVRKPPPAPPDPQWPRGFKVDDEIERRLLAEAKWWMDYGWDDKDDFDDVIAWWKNWFSPEEAWIFQEDMAEYDKIANGVRSSYGLPMPVAIELRDRGIDALDVLDATRQVSEKINIRDADDVQRAVEKSREWMKANKRRRSSRRRGR
jgi:hypothetical protein